MPGDDRDVHGHVLVFEGRSDLSVYASIADAEGGTEVYDLHLLTYFLTDGTLLVAEADGYRVRLRLSSENRQPELRARLREYLTAPTIGLDPRLADDPAAAARVLLSPDRPARRRKWWLSVARPPHPPGATITCGARLAGCRRSKVPRTSL